MNDLNHFLNLRCWMWVILLGLVVLFLYSTGEISVNVASFTLLTKSLHPLPEKYHGLQDKEARYRRRYVDLIANPDVMDVFKKRSSVIRDIRNYLGDQDFMEVETPVLHHIYGVLLPDLLRRIIMS